MGGILSVCTTKEDIIMAKRGKRYQEVAKLVDREKLYSPAEAIELVKQCATAKFDETVEVAMKLGGLIPPPRRSAGAGGYSCFTPRHRARCEGFSLC